MKLHRKKKIKEKQKKTIKRKHVSSILEKIEQLENPRRNSKGARCKKNPTKMLASLDKSRQ